MISTTKAAGPVGVLALVALGALAGCGDDTSGTGGGGAGGDASGGGATGGGGTGGSEAGAWQSYCEAHVAREESCDTQNPPSPSLSECLGAEACFEAIIRAEARGPLLDCLSTRSCTTSDDSCFAQTAAALPAGPGQADYEAACAAKLAGCPDGAFSNDWCTDGDVPIGVFSATLYAELGTCFDLGCDMVGDCLDGSVAALLAPCGGQIGF